MGIFRHIHGALSCPRCARGWRPIFNGEAIGTLHQVGAVSCKAAFFVTLHIVVCSLTTGHRLVESEE